MARFFFSAVEFIKERRFEVYVPAFYHPVLPQEMLNPKPAPLERPNPWKKVATRRRDPTPFRQLQDPNQLQRASYTIEIMLDMFRKKIEFIIANDDDIPEMFDGVDRYLESIKPDVSLGVERTVDYARLVVAWRGELYKHYYRYMKTHPTALDKLYPGEDKNKNIFALLSAVGTDADPALSIDPLLSKRNPPYDIDKTIPGGDKQQTAQQRVEDLLGISSNSGPVVDDGRDFNFEDFLRKG